MRKFLLGAAAIMSLGAASAMAAPLNTPFLSIDFNGSGGGPATSPTQSGFQAFGVANQTTAGSMSLSNTYGAYTVTIATNPSATGATLTSRDRGAQGSSPANSDVLRDFALVLRDSGHALGYSYLSVSISGLTPNQTYEFTGISEDPNSASAGTNREGYSTVVPAEYSPAAGYANAPTGPNYHYTPVMAPPNGLYDQSTSFNVTANASGVATVYVFGDAVDYNQQTATIINAFQLGAVPEPTTLAALSLGGVALGRRRRA